MELEIRETDLLETLADLIQLETIAGQEEEGQRYVARYLEQLGIATDVWEIDIEALRSNPAFGMEVNRESALGVVGVMGEEGNGRSLILNGHIDVVPAGDESNWSHPPWEATLQSGRVYGRGSCDMKGGVACILTAVKALVEARVKLAGRLIIESVVAEEDGGLGTLAAVERGYRADGAIVVEPTNLVVAPGCAGALSFRIEVTGLSAHAAVREEGVSAVEKFIPIYRALQTLEETRNDKNADRLFDRYRVPFPISIGTVRSGDWPSSVPESLVAEGRLGIATGEDLDGAREEFEEAVAAAAEQDVWLRDHPPSVEWWGGQFAPARISDDHPLIAKVREASGEPLEIAGMTYGSDLRLLVNEGETSGVLFGPGDIRQAHRPDEFVEVDQLMKAARILAVSVVRWCNER